MEPIAGSDRPVDVCPGRSGTGRLTSTEQEKTSSIESVRMAMLLNRCVASSPLARRSALHTVQRRGFAGHGAAVQFRNVRIKRLK